MAVAKLRQAGQAPPGSRVRADRIHDAADQFDRAASSRGLDPTLQHKMTFIAEALRAYHWIITHLNASNNDLRSYFSHSSWFSHRLFSVAADDYSHVPGWLTGDLGITGLLTDPDLGPGMLPQSIDEISLIGFLVLFFNIMTNRLRFSQDLRDALPSQAISFPPEPSQVQAYFRQLGSRGRPHNDIVTAYQTYARAFFWHAGYRDQDIDYDAQRLDRSTESVYGQGMTDDESSFGSLLIDCDGYARLGRELFSNAGYIFRHYVMRAMIPATGQIVFPLRNVHTITVLNRGSSTAVITNDSVRDNEQSGFVGIQWRPEVSQTRAIEADGQTLQETLGNLANQLAPLPRQPQRP